MIISSPSSEVSAREKFYEFFKSSYGKNMVPREEFDEAWSRPDGALFYLVHEEELLAAAIVHADRVVHTATSTNHWRRGLYVHLAQAMSRMRPGLHRTVNTKFAGKIGPLLLESGYRPISEEEIDHSVLDKFKAQGRDIGIQEGLVTVSFQRPSADPAGTQFVYLDRG